MLLGDSKLVLSQQDYLQWQ